VRVGENFRLKSQRRLAFLSSFLLMKCRETDVLGLDACWAAANRWLGLVGE